MLSNYIKCRKIKIVLICNYGHKKHIGLTGLELLTKNNTVIDIEIISDEDFKNGNNSWHSIFASDKKLVIDANNIIQNSSYEVENIDIKKNSLFRVNFLETGKKSIIDNTRIQGLTVQINIDIKD